MRILLTTTSYQDTPGEHHKLLEASGYEVVRERGPLPEAKMLELAKTGGFDGILHGDDEITRPVIEAALPKLKVLAKYGIGLDSVDVKAATDLKVPVCFTPGVNHTTVAEHTFGLMIMLAKQMVPHANSVKAGEWKRKTGIELMGKTIGIMGLGRIGKEVAIRAKAFGMNIVGYDIYWDENFAQQYSVKHAWSVDEILSVSNVLTLHMNLTDENRHFINRDTIAKMPKDAFVINCARGGLIHEQDVAEACKSGALGGYAGDVLEHEPIQTPHPFQDVDNVIITPHIGSRTFESVERQAVRATKNLVNFLEGNDDYIQANEF